MHILRSMNNAMSKTAAAKVNAMMALAVERGYLTVQDARLMKGAKPVTYRALASSLIVESKHNALMVSLCQDVRAALS
jgi:predicted transcriptional regulator of viral defense system